MLRVVIALALAAMLTVVLFTQPVGATVTTADSSCQEALQKGLIFLDRQGSSIACGGDTDAKFMSGFGYTGCGGSNFKFALKCLDPVYGYPTARTLVHTLQLYFSRVTPKGALWYEMKSLHTGCSYSF